MKTIAKTINLFNIESYKIPFSLDIILKSIIDLSCNNEEIKSLCNTSVNERDLEDPNNIEILIPGILKCILDLNEQNIKTLKYRKQKILITKNKLQELFSDKCLIK